MTETQCPNACNRPRRSGVKKGETMRKLRILGIGLVAGYFVLTYTFVFTGLSSFSPPLLESIRKGEPISLNLNRPVAIPLFVMLCTGLALIRITRHRPK